MAALTVYLHHLRANCSLTVHIEYTVVLTFILANIYSHNVSVLMRRTYVITGPHNGPVLVYSLVFVVCRCRLSSSVTLPAGGRAGRRARGPAGGRHCTAGQYGYVPLGRHLFIVSLFSIQLGVRCRIAGKVCVPCGSDGRAEAVSSREPNTFSI